MCKIKVDEIYEYDMLWLLALMNFKILVRPFSEVMAR